jgi:hypothetical protein
METFNITLDMQAITNQCKERGVDNVERSEIETVLRAVLSQYIKDGWISEVIYAEVNQLRADPANYKKEASIE